ncbi:HECT-domain-containing protein [Pisolithus sp. B1]|nr:HECT-domain-containing protein [Pisolithus sp. B1]
MRLLIGHEHGRVVSPGGSMSVAAALEQAKTRRIERKALRRREESALKIQSWWRGALEARNVRLGMRQLCMENMPSLTGLRSLVFVGRDDDLLRHWSAVMSMDDNLLFAGAASRDQAHWVNLLCRVSVLLIRSVAKAPSSVSELAHLQVLCKLLDRSYATRVLGSPDSDLPHMTTQYVMQHGFYQSVRSSIEAIGLNSKDDPAIPYLVKLVYLPFSNISPLTELFAQYLHHLVIHIFTIPLLPYCIPPESLSELSSNLPLAYLQALSPRTTDIVMQTSILGKINIIANLLALIPLSFLHPPSIVTIATYIQLLRALLSSLPAGTLDPPLPDPKLPSLGDDRNAHAVLPVLDMRTRRGLQALPSSPHLSVLLNHARQHPQLLPDVVGLLMALNIVWPTAKDNIFETLLRHGGGGMVHEIYRDQLHSTSLGSDENITAAMIDPRSLENRWPPLLLLADLYAYALRTLGDDEFFSDSRALLTINDLVSFSRTLFNVTFNLYWRGHEWRLQDNKAPGLPLCWFNVRGRLTKCLQAIHALDSRWPFLPPSQWRIDMQVHKNSFICASVHEEQWTAKVFGPHVTSRLPRPSFSQLCRHLRILSNIPFSTPFETRAQIFHLFVQADMTKRTSGRFSHLNGVQIGGREEQWTDEVSGPRVPSKLPRADFCHLCPRLRNLSNIPFAVLLETRGHAFRSVVHTDVATRSCDQASVLNHVEISIHRGRIAQDGYDKLSGVDLRFPIAMTFIDQFGEPEHGIDPRGVFKEFFTSSCKDLFDTASGLWLKTKTNEIYPNAHSYTSGAHTLSWYRFIGRILGKALYEGILVEVVFAGFFLAKWSDKQIFLGDLAPVDPDLYHRLISLKNSTGPVEDLRLTFTVATEEFGVTKVVDLIPNGSCLPVTRENRLRYIYLILHYRLAKQIKLQSEAFLEGLSEMIDPKWLRIFNQQELQILLGGANSLIDYRNLRKYTHYGQPYNDQHPTIRAFWKVMKSFDQEESRAFLRFVTNCSRPPLLGFMDLNPNFTILDGGDNQHCSPTASTCVNLLKLPRYIDEAILREQLLQAISSSHK